MSGVLVVAETRHGELRPISFELITAGRTMKRDGDGGLAVAVIDSAPEQHASELAIAGVDEVLSVAAPTEHFEPFVHEQALARLIEIEQPSLILTGMTIDALGFAPAVAASHELGFASDVTEMRWEEGLTAIRPDYGGKVEAELDFRGKDCALLMVREGSFERSTGERGSVSSRTLELELDRTAVPTEHFEFVAAESEGDASIDQADFLLSVGRGIEDAADVKQFEELAERLGATLAASRPLVDAGWIPAARQVGQSGKTVSPKVYLAMGISGAAQHLAGIRGADTIIAINNDPEAPIFHIANFGAVADMFDVADELAARFED